MELVRHSLDDKALKINLDEARYGTLAEIGAGQEVARHFFRVGGAAGTVAKSISAYDMKFSDAIYGTCDRYVSKARVQTMLAYEFDLLVERLEEQRGERCGFFTFADTVATRSYSRKQDGKGWLGVKFQRCAREEPSQVILHARLLDDETVLQQEALGILGVNLIYSALYEHAQPDVLLKGLQDHLGRDRVDINVIDVSGPAFQGVDNRLLNLQLVRLGLTHGVLFDSAGQIAEPSTLLYKKPIVVQRGTFRPFTRVHEHMLRAAKTQFSEVVDDDDIVTLMEITTSNLRDTSAFEPNDFLSRMDTLSALDLPVLVSDFSEFYRLENFLHQYTNKNIAFAIGVQILAEIFNEDYYDNLEGGILEAFGRLFRREVQLYVYPYKREETQKVITANNVEIPAHLAQLYRYLLDNHFVAPMTDVVDELFDIASPEVLEQIRSGEPAWETAVPECVARVIKKQGLFGHGDLVREAVNAK